MLVAHLGLGLTGWRLIEACVISDDGLTIAVVGTNPLGQQEAWVVSLAVPEPITSLLLCLGLAGLAVVRRRS